MNDPALPPMRGTPTDDRGISSPSPPGMHPGPAPRMGQLTGQIYWITPLPDIVNFNTSQNRNRFILEAHHTRTDSTGCSANRMLLRIHDSADGTRFIRPLFNQTSQVILFPSSLINIFMAIPGESWYISIVGIFRMDHRSGAGLWDTMLMRRRE
jgi:hypothetical protein